MAYVRRLIHRAAFHRATVATSEAGVEKSTYTAVPSQAAVPCLLIPANARRSMEIFGPDVVCEAFVLFNRGTDVRPNVNTTAGGQNDKLVITDEKGNVSTWMVVGSRDAASARQMIIAGVKKATL